MTQTFTQHFIVDGEHLATIETGPVYYRGQFIAPDGIAFFCPLCSTLWAVCPVEGHSTNVMTCYCKRHRPGDKTFDGWGAVMQDDLPGSLWLDWPEYWPGHLPLPVLWRELELEVAEVERKNPGVNYQLTAGLESVSV